MNKIILPIVVIVFLALLLFAMLEIADIAIVQSILSKQALITLIPPIFISKLCNKTFKNTEDDENHIIRIIFYTHEKRRELFDFIPLFITIFASTLFINSLGGEDSTFDLHSKIILRVVIFIFILLVCNDIAKNTNKIFRSEFNNRISVSEAYADDLFCHMFQKNVYGLREHVWSINRESIAKSKEHELLLTVAYFLIGGISIL